MGAAVAGGEEGDTEVLRRPSGLTGRRGEAQRSAPTWAPHWTAALGQTGRAAGALLWRGSSGVRVGHGGMWRGLLDPQAWTWGRGPGGSARSGSRAWGQTRRVSRLEPGHEADEC